MQNVQAAGEFLARRAASPASVVHVQPSPPTVVAPRAAASDIARRPAPVARETVQEPVLESYQLSERAYLLAFGH
jgi:hypothetical protein